MYSKPYVQPESTINENLLSALDNDLKAAELHNGVVRDLAVPLAGVEVVREADRQLVHDVRHREAHLLNREVLAHAVCGPERERHKRVRVVCQLLLRRLQALCDEPPVGIECLWVREVARVAVHGPEVDAGLVALGDVAVEVMRERPGG